MFDAQEFIRTFSAKPHTIRELFNALTDNGLTKEETDKELKKHFKSVKNEGFDQHTPINDKHSE